MLDHLITRRSVVALVAGCPLTAHAMKVAGGKITPPAVIFEASQWWISENTRQYRLDGGMMGRGRQISVPDMLCLVPALKQLGFSPWATPSGEGMSRIIPIYAMDGAPSSLVWHCFTRGVDSLRNDIVAFEQPIGTLKNSTVIPELH